MHTTPPSLLQRLREPGQNQAWDTFVELYTPPSFFWSKRWGLQDSDAADLVQEVTLKRLILDGSFVDGPGLASLDKQSALTDLSLASCGLTDELLQTKLPKLPAMKRFVLDGNDIRGRGLPKLNDQPELIDLSLNCPSIGDLLAKNLAELKRIKRLSLVGANLTDAGIRHLEALTNLTALDLRKTQATAAGIERLHQALPKCRIEWDAGVQEPKKQ